MKVLTISTVDYGGAGKMALDTHELLLKNGIESKMLVAEKKSKVDEVYIAKPVKKYYAFKMVKFIRKVFWYFGLPSFTLIGSYQRKIYKIPRKKRTLFTLPITEYDLASHPLVKEADIIHLHWVDNFIDYKSFFGKIKKPIIWTFHDESIGHGGFHYQIDKEINYILYKSIEDEFFYIKKEALLDASNIHVVALSKMMKTFCKKQSILSNSPISIICNYVNLEMFYPCDKNSARKKYFIPEESLVFMFSANFIDQKRKGLKELIEAIEGLQISNVVLLCTGYGQIPYDTNITIKCMGYVPINELRVLYSCSDFFVLPSFQEACARTPIEAMACGTPVIAFPCSGVEDVMSINTGVICSSFTVESLKDGIEKALKQVYNSSAITEYVRNNFSPETYLRQYISLYKNVLSNAKKN